MPLCWKSFIRQFVVRADSTEAHDECRKNDPIIYKSLKGEEFIQKSDCYRLLYLIYSKCFILPQYNSYFTTEFDHYFICSILAAFIKYHESQLNGTCEFVKYEEEVFVEIANKNESTMNADLKLYESNSYKTQSFREYLTSRGLEHGPTLFRILFTNLTNEISTKIDLLFNEVLEKKLPDYNEWLFKMFSVMCSPENSVPTVTSTYPPFFLPLNPTNLNGESIVVRIFEQERNEKFVMKSELFNAFSILDPNQRKPECEIDVVTTISYADVLRKYKDRISKVEFIRVPVHRSKTTTVRQLQTPSGEFCIPAVDALFQLLNRLIFKEKAFQKYKMENWALLKVSISSLEQFFTPYHKCTYFITVTEADAAAENMMNHLIPPPEEITLKSVGKVKKDGFTVEHLKNEMANLELLELLPEVQEYAEAVYSEVFKSKKEEFLRTCDLSDAVEKCLLICIFKKFPNLQLFLHTQNACHRLPSLFCEYCAKTSKSGKFKNAEWNDFSSKEAISSYGSNPKLSHCQLTLPNGSILCNNFKFFPPEEIKRMKMTYFIMDQTKRKQKKVERNSEHLHSLSQFINKYPHENIYIRAIPTTPTLKYSEQTRRVFAEEALEIIQILLNCHNSSISKSIGMKEKFEKYHKKFERKSGCIATINLAEFWYMLEEFDVDKTRITIVPDPIHELSLLKLTEDLRNVTLNVIGPKGDIVIRKEQVVLHMFETMISELDWNQKPCETLTDCWDIRREVLIVTLDQFVKSLDGDYVFLAMADYIINYMKRDTFSRRHVTESSPLFRLQNSKFDEPIPVETFISGFKEAGLDVFLEKHPEFSEDQSAPAWFCRIRYFRGFMFHLLDSHTYDTEDMIWNEVILRQPEKKKHREEEHRFQQIWKNNSEAEDRNASKSCAKCLRTSEICNEAKKELKLTQNKLEKNEKKAKRTEEVEKELKALMLEMKKKEKEAERRELEMEKKEKENEELKTKLSKLEANEIRMRLDINQNKMQLQIADLSSQLEDKNQKNEELQGQVIQLTRKEKSLNNKISKKENQVKKLQGTNQELLIRISHLEQSNSNLLEEITTISREGLGSPDDPKNRLLRLEKILESYSHGYQLKHSKEMVEKLKSCSDSVKIHQIADYERDQYDGKLMRYVHEVEMNIQKIKTTKDCTLITPLPEQPSFSNRFMDLYWKIINNQPITSTDLEVRDSECFICTEEMIYSQKTMICKECKKQTHWKCSSKWLKIHKSCPHCRREMLDPNEFPDLS